MKDILALDKKSKSDANADDSEQEKEAPEGKFYLFLDQVTDPQNFGSILRSAMFIGVDGVIVNRRNACGLTAVVSKVSSGALEFIPLYSVKFVSHFFDDAKKDPLNFKIISTNLEDASEGLGSLVGGSENQGPDGENYEDDHLNYMDSEDENVDEIVFGNMDGEDSSSRNNQKEEDTNSSSKLTPLDQLRLPRGGKSNVILVLGSEGEGVSRTIA